MFEQRVCHLFLVLCTAIALAGTVSKVTGEGGNGSLAVACHFATTVAVRGNRQHTQVNEWYLWREPSQVETCDKNGKRCEVWQRTQDGQVFYSRVFHNDKRVIEYMPGDLRALQRYPAWSHVASVIEPSLVKDQLRPTGQVSILGRQAQRYQGTVQGVTLDVWWLDREQLPALVQYVYPDRMVTLRLKKLYPLDESPWSRGRTAGYVHIDYADLGDKVSDPFVRRLQREEWHTHIDP